MLTLACLKPSQAPYPFSDKIWIFQLILQGLCGQEPALASSESSPSLNHFAPAIPSLYAVMGNCQVQTSPRDFACAPGCPRLPVLCPVWWFPKCGPWTSSINVTWKIVRNINSYSCPPPWLHPSVRALRVAWGHAAWSSSSSHRLPPGPLGGHPLPVSPTFQPLTKACSLGRIFWRKKT